MQQLIPTKRPRFRRAAHALPEVAHSFADLPRGTARLRPEHGSDPWDNAVNVLKTAFTGTIATGLSAGRHRGRRTDVRLWRRPVEEDLAGIVFGVGMAIGAVNFMAWLFP